MYRNSYDDSLRNEVRFGKKIMIWFVAFVALASGIAWLMTRGGQAAETAVLRYEEFQEIYNTCQKINTDLATVRAVDSSDRMFASFSKASAIAQKRQQLTRWIEEYNGKSRMWTRSLWKSGSLPYQLSTDNFNHYDEGAQ